MTPVATPPLDSRLRRIAAELARAEGVLAVVLGGSHATGTARPGSDVDLGIWYATAAPPHPDSLRSAIGTVERELMPLSAPGAWGPWMNGGGTFVVDGREVDLIYRDVDRVRGFVGEFAQGMYQIVYQPGQPDGFASHTYLGELQVSIPLEDRKGVFASLRGSVEPYPTALRDAIVRGFGWEAALVLRLLAKPGAAADRLYGGALVHRFVGCLAQLVFAANHRGWLGDKNAVRRAGAFARVPADFVERCERLVRRDDGICADGHALLADVERVVREAPR